MKKPRHAPGSTAVLTVQPVRDGDAPAILLVAGDGREEEELLYVILYGPGR